MEPERILNYFQDRQGPIHEAIRSLVEIESPSHDAECSRRVVDLVEQLARSTGADLTLERASVADGDHLIIRAFPSEERPILLLGHTDTVHPIGTKLQNPTRIEGDRFYGCGIFDMKSGIVLMLEALRYFAAAGTRPSAPLTILLSCDEEVGSLSGRELVEREAANARFCLVFEPSAAGRIKTGRKGTAMYRLNAHGVPSHAGLEPEKGANAIAELSRHIDAIHLVADPTHGTAVNVTTIQGGTTSNVIPEHASCEIDVRFSNAAEAARVDSALRAVASVDTRVSLSVAGGINRPPMERTPAVAALFDQARSAAAAFGYDLGETQVGGASDGNFVAALGVPVLDGLGIRGDGAHTLDEHIIISDVAKRLTLITSMLK